jgi:hypothetical protein
MGEGRRFILTECYSYHREVQGSGLIESECRFLQAECYSCYREVRGSELVESERSGDRETAFFVGRGEGLY